MRGKSSFLTENFNGLFKDISHETFIGKNPELPILFETRPPEIETVIDTVKPKKQKSSKTKKSKNDSSETSDDKSLSVSNLVIEPPVQKRLDGKITPATTLPTPDKFNFATVNLPVSLPKLNSILTASPVPEFKIQKEKKPERIEQKEYNPFESDEPQSPGLNIRSNYYIAQKEETKKLLGDILNNPLVANECDNRLPLEIAYNTVNESVVSKELV